MKSTTLAFVGAGILAFAGIGFRLAYVRFHTEAGNGHNLEHVKCQSANGGSKDVTIYVHGTGDVLAFNDKLTFVCKDEKIHWERADVNVDSFIVRFKTDSPFIDGTLALPSNSSGQTDVKAVKQLLNNKKYEVDEYELVMTPVGGGPPKTADPHVIPMG